MNQQASLFDMLTISRPLSVPFAPGSATSRAAAKRIAPAVSGRRERVMELYRTGQRLTADEVAAALGEAGFIYRWRPRVCECAKAGLILLTGQTRPSAFGEDQAGEYRMATREEMASALRRHELAEQTATTTKDATEARKFAAWVRAEMEAA